MGKPEIRVLLVEDDEDDYLITSELLAEIPGERFRLDWVLHYQDALKDMTSGGHDVYLVDYRLGAHDGIDLVREAIASGCQAPMILLTGQGDTEVDLAAMRAGVSDYLVKSQISAPILDRAIRYALERKANEDRLRRSEQRFRDLVNGLDAIVWEADAHTFAFQFVSRRAEAILGYPTADWLSGPEFWNRLIHPDDRVMAWAGYAVTASQGRDEEFRHRAVAADGRTVWLRNNVHVVRDTHGRPERLRGVMVDITPAKQAELHLSAMVDGLRAVFSSADELLSSTDQDSLLKRAVELARERLGLERCRIFLLDERSQIVRGTFGTDLRGQTTDERELRLQRGESWDACGRVGDTPGPRWLLLDDEPLQEWNGSGYRELESRGWLAITPIQAAHGMVGTFVNDTAASGRPHDEIQQEVVAVYCSVLGSILENKRVEEALRASEASLASAQRLAHLGSWEYDLLRGSLHWSEETYRIFGRTPGVDIPSDDLFWGAVHPDEQALVREGVREALDRGGRFELELRIGRPDGSERTVSTYAEVSRDAAGYPVRLIGTVHDVTDRIQLEEQLRQSQKMEAVGRLAGGVAHDFNNMLAVIAGYCELLLESARLDPLLQPALQEIKKAGERAATLTRQLLAFSRKSMLAPQVLDLNQVVDNMAAMLRRLIGEDIELVLEPGADLGRVRADPGQVAQVVLNLAVNARDAMPEGGILRLSTTNVCLDLAHSTQYPEVMPGDYVLLTMQDCGCGMDARTLARIFEPFFTTKGPGIGTGLGLATVYGIVNQSGGHINVESEVGKGTVFRVYLPRTDAGLRPAEVREPVAAPHRGTGTIVVVEDEEMLRGLVRNILERNGYRVLDAPGAEQALPILDNLDEPVDLLITDVVMPGISGPEMARQALERRPTLQVLYMSGYTDDVVLQHGMLENSTSFIGKPFTPDAIIKRVQEILSTKSRD